MMRSNFNRFGWQRLLAVALLLSALLPVQTLFACEMMGGPAKTDCCCDHPTLMDGCKDKACAPVSQNTLGDLGCCQASLDDGTVFVSTTLSQPDIGLDGEVQPSQPPPYIALLNSLDTLVPLAAFQAVIDVGQRIVSPATPTYRTTQRIRI